MKQCPKCGETKPTTEFNKHASRSDGLQYQCKACCEEYRASNSDKAKASFEAWKSSNRDKMKAYSAAYYAANPDKCKAANAAWRAVNPESNRIVQQNRRARQRSNGGRLSPGLAAKLFKLQRGKCACCHVSIKDGNHLDHRIPVALGGPNEDWNMQLLCGPCNLSKAAKHPVDFMQSRGYLL